MAGIQYHLLLCATPIKAKCCDPAVGTASWQRLKSLIKQLGLEDPTRPEGIVWRTKADCLRICQDGPILLVWPEGITYGGVTPDRVDRIVHEHLIGGSPIQEWVLTTAMFKML